MRTARIREGYGTIQRDVMCMSGISVYAKAVYSLFVSYSGQKDCCYPTIRTISHNLDISRPTVIKAIRELESVHLLDVERELGEGSIYYPNYLLQGEINEGQVRVGKPGKPAKPILFVEHDGGQAYIGFDDYQDVDGIVHKGFWNLYDKKTDKKKTNRSWNKLSPNTRAFVMTRIPLYINHQVERQYRKSPYSYLLNECWDDEDLHRPTSKTQAVTPRRGKLSTHW